MLSESGSGQGRCIIAIVILWWRCCLLLAVVLVGFGVKVLEGLLEGLFEGMVGWCYY